MVRRLSVTLEKRKKLELALIQYLLLYFTWLKITHWLDLLYPEKHINVAIY